MTSRSLIEQAVFTSARAHHCDGYHLVATSPGVSVQDARELTIWGPTHDSLARHCPAVGSVNFHPLPSGAWCVSLTTAAGSEYSGRGGPRVYTQCLLVPGCVMSRFANNPFRIIEAGSAAGHLDVLNEVPGSLAAFPLVGRATPLDVPSLKWLASELGPRGMVALVQAAVSARFLGIVNGPPPERLLRGLICLLPPACRTELSLSTGLRVSSQRPFRVLPVEPDPTLCHRLTQRAGTMLLDLSPACEYPSAKLQPWIGLLLELLRGQQWERLADWYRTIEADTRLEDMDRIATQWRWRSTALAAGHDPGCPAALADAPEACASESERTTQSVDKCPTQCTPAAAAQQPLRAHSAPPRTRTRRLLVRPAC